MDRKLPSATLPPPMSSRHAVALIAVSFKAPSMYRTPSPIPAEPRSVLSEPSSLCPPAEPYAEQGLYLDGSQQPFPTTERARPDSPP